MGSPEDPSCLGLNEVILLAPRNLNPKPVGSPIPASHRTRECPMSQAHGAASAGFETAGEPGPFKPTWL